MVDDEAVIREGIIHSIDWEQYDIKIAGEASNGKEAIKLVKELSPDIVVTDIRMPVMDGLELAKSIEKETPAIKMIILTGYGEFEYAQKAIEYKVSEFILKPVGAEELVKVVLKLRDEILKERKRDEDRNSYEKLIKENMPVIQEKFLYQLLNGLYGSDEKDKISKIIDILHMDLSGPHLQVFIIAIDDYFHLVGKQPIEQRKRIFDSIISIVKDTVSTHTKGYIYQNEIGMFTSLINKNYFDITALCRQIQYRISHDLKLPVSIGIGNEAEDLFHIHKSYSEAFNAVRNRIYKGRNTIIHANEITKRGSCTSVTYINSFNEEENEIQVFIQLLDDNKINNLLDRVFNRFITEKTEFNCIRNISLYFIIAAIKGMKQIGICIEDQMDMQFDPFLEIEEYETVEQIREWMKNVFKKLLSVIENNKNEKYKYIVKIAMDYMINNYNKPLSLSNVAQKVHVTPNYLSKVFRDETGENFIEWLNKYRIDKAKEYLRNIGMKTYEVAKRVGFNNYKHFSYNFKKYTGCSPLEFRERK